MTWIYKWSEKEDEKVLEKDTSGQVEKEGIILGLKGKQVLSSVATCLNFHWGSLNWLFRRNGRTEKDEIFQQFRFVRPAEDIRKIREK